MFLVFFFFVSISDCRIMNYVTRRFLRCAMVVFSWFVVPYSRVTTLWVPRKRLPSMTNPLLEIRATKLAHMIRTKQVWYRCIHAAVLSDLLCMRVQHGMNDECICYPIDRPKLTFPFLPPPSYLFPFLDRNSNQKLKRTGHKRRGRPSIYRAMQRGESAGKRYCWRSLWRSIERSAPNWPGYCQWDAHRRGNGA